MRSLALLNQNVINSPLFIERKTGDKYQLISNYDYQSIQENVISNILINN